MPCPAVAPKSTSSTMRRFFQLPKLSRNGAIDDLPCALIDAKSGDSFRVRRIQSEIATRTIEIKNGRRQTHALKSAWHVTFLTPRITPRDAKSPSAAVSR